MGPAHVVSGVVDPELDGGDGLVARGTVLVRMAERKLSDMQGRPLEPFVSRFFFFFFLIFHPSGCQAMFLHASGRRDGLPRAGVMRDGRRFVLVGGGLVVFEALLKKRIEGRFKNLSLSLLS